MIKFFAKRRYRKGFTLTETIVVVALIAIIMACVVAFGTPVRGLVRNASDRDDALTINKIIGDYIERQLSFASNMEIYVGYDYNNTDTALLNSYNQYLNFGKATSIKNRPGMMVFKFIPGTDTSGSFRLLNYTIRPDEHGNWPTMPTANDILDSDVFSDVFYSGMQFFMTSLEPDTATNEVATNAMNKAYINFAINAYSMEDGISMEDSDVKGYFNETLSLNNSKEIEKKSTAFDSKFGSYKLGSEKVSFAIENMKASVKTEPVYTIPGDNTSPIDHYEMKTEKPNLGVHRSDTGTDIIIFYNIKTYEFT